MFHFPHICITMNTKLHPDKYAFLTFSSNEYLRAFIDISSVTIKFLNQFFSYIFYCFFECVTQSILSIDSNTICAVIAKIEFFF